MFLSVASTRTKTDSAPSDTAGMETSMGESVKTSIGLHFYRSRKCSGAELVGCPANTPCHPQVACHVNFGVAPLAALCAFLLPRLWQFSRNRTKVIRIAGFAREFIQKTTRYCRT